MKFLTKYTKVILQIIVTLCTFWYKSTIINCSYANNEINDDFLKVSKVSFLDLDNNEHIFHEYVGHMLLVYFWASWCLECLSELKTLDSLQDMLITDEISDIKVIPISIDFANNQVIKNIYDQYNLTKIPLFIDRNKFAMSSFGINTPPTTFILDKHSSIIFRFENSVHWTHPDVYKKLKSLRNIEEPQLLYQTILHEIIGPKQDNMIIKNDKQRGECLILR